MSSFSLLSNRYFDKLAVNRLQAQEIKIENPIETIKNIIKNFINKFSNLEDKGLAENTKQILHLNTNTNQADILQEFKIENENFLAINTYDGVCKVNLKSIEKISKNIYKFTIYDNYNIILYTTYTNQNRFAVINNILLNSFKKCTQHMMDLNTQATFKWKENFFLIKFLDGHKYDNDNNVQYFVELIFDINTGIKDIDIDYDINTFYNQEVELICNFNKSLYNCGPAVPPIDGW